ncbi:hypothetical protein HY641_04855 [Candidatus Woesearchaeota archaeon]|nr:hypothetical protein [Candidatus Woesearchaeota archaeon]
MLQTDPLRLELDHRIYPQHKIAPVLNDLGLRPTEQTDTATVIESDISKLLHIVDHLTIQNRSP